MVVGGVPGSPWDRVRCSHSQQEVSLWVVGEQGWQELQEEKKKKYVCEEADVSQLRQIDTSAPGESLLAEQRTLAEDLKEGGGVS